MRGPEAPSSTSRAARWKRWSASIAASNPLVSSKSIAASIPLPPGSYSPNPSLNSSSTLSASVGSPLENSGNLGLGGSNLCVNCRTASRTSSASLRPCAAAARSSAALSSCGRYTVVFFMPYTIPYRMPLSLIFGLARAALVKVYGLIPSFCELFLLYTRSAKIPSGRPDHRYARSREQHRWVVRQGPRRRGDPRGDAGLQGRLARRAVRVGRDLWAGS